MDRVIARYHKGVLRLWFGRKQAKPHLTTFILFENMVAMFGKQMAEKLFDGEQITHKGEF